MLANCFVLFSIIFYIFFRRQKEAEQKSIQEEANKRIEEMVSKRVEEELERRRDEIEEERGDLGGGGGVAAGWLAGPKIANGARGVPICPK